MAACLSTRKTPSFLAPTALFAVAGPAAGALPGGRGRVPKLPPFCPQSPPIGRFSVKSCSFVCQRWLPRSAAESCRSVPPGGDRSPAEPAALGRFFCWNCLRDLSDAAERAIEMGLELREVKHDLQHGQWRPWVSAECDFSWDTAERYMLVAKQFGHLEKRHRVAFGLNAMHLLMRRDTPAGALDEAEQRAPSTSFCKQLASESLTKQNRAPVLSPCDFALGPRMRVRCRFLHLYIGGSAGPVRIAPWVINPRSGLVGGAQGGSACVALLAIRRTARRKNTIGDSCLPSGERIVRGPNSRVS
jgi:hypothetical protein